MLWQNLELSSYCGCNYPVAFETEGMFVFPMIIYSFFIHKMALRATALCRFLCLKNSIISGILFGFEQINYFLFKLKIYMRDCFTVNLMDTLIFLLFWVEELYMPSKQNYLFYGHGDLCHFQSAEVVCLKTLESQALSRSTAPQFCLQNAALMQFQRIQPPLVATGEISCKCPCASLNRTLLLVWELPRQHMN